MNLVKEHTWKKEDGETHRDKKMKLTKDQKREQELEYLYKNRNKIVADGLEYQNLRLKERNQMKTTSPELYDRKKKHYHLAFREFIRR